MKPFIPVASGVYCFKDSDNQILYIGKAKCLRSRVQSYFHNQGRDLKIEALIQEHAKIEYILTRNETEALLLEAELIKKHQPKFNVMLKGGQPFIYLLFTKEAVPKLVLVRNKKRKGTYFGPFIHKTQARSVYQFLLQTFKLRLCNKKISNGCLDYHLGTCAGNCRNDFNQDDYLFRLQLAMETLKHNHTEFLAHLDKKIRHYSKELAFEKAKQLLNYKQHCDLIFSTIKTKFTLNRFLADIIMITQQPDVSHQLHKLTQDLQTFLNINHSIRTIDCFDISHFQSKSIVGSCVRFTDGIPDKNKFRRFKIKTLETQNDYAALQEIVTRRYKKKEDPPDLILIDGGKGQLNAIVPLMTNVHCVALAKKEERLFSRDFPEGKKLDIHTRVGQLLIALRDYAHHFALSYHRKRRSKTIKEA